MSIEFDICNEIAYLRNNNIATDRLRFLEDKLHTMNVENRNNQLVSSMARKILKNENINQKILKMLQITNNKLEHALIYGPTQIGKTNAIIQFIKTCIEQKIPVIVSSDNKSDQQEQLYERIYKQLKAYPCELIKAEDSDCDDIMKCITKDIIPVVFCLDNHSQIKQVKSLFMEPLMSEEKYKQLAILHDEGDVVTRGAEVYENDNKKRAKSHESWINLIHVFSKK